MPSNPSTPNPPTPPCSISLDVLTTTNGITTEAAQEALAFALNNTPVGASFKSGECKELIVLFHSVGP